MRTPRTATPYNDRYGSTTRAYCDYNQSKLVCTGTTGHAETLRLEYDPARIGYDQLRTVFWRIRDPTTLDRQGLDVGDQYRPVIFYADEEQKKAALASKAVLEASRRYPGRGVPPALLRQAGRRLVRREALIRCTTAVTRRSRGSADRWAGPCTWRPAGPGS
jgi:hypothetical protein